MIGDLRRRPPRLLFAGAVAALAVAAGGCGISLQSLPKIGGVTGPTYTVTARFADVVNLPANAEVRVGPFAAGYVSSITAKDFSAIVAMKIKRSQRLPVGTTAQVRFDTPLGEDFIQLTPPTETPPPPSTEHPAYLGPGSRLSENETTTAPSIEDLLAATGALLNGGGISQLRTIITQVNDALRGNQPQVKSLIGSLNATLATFAGSEGAFDRALGAIGSLAQTLNDNRSVIATGIGALQPAVAVLDSQNTTFRTLVAQVDQLAAVAGTVVTRGGTGFVSTVRQLAPVVHQLNEVQQQLGPDLRALDALEKGTPGIAPGDYLQVALTATADVPAVPAGALPLKKVTVDPPQQDESNRKPAIVTIMEGALP
ncbi:MCE family protein [Acidiferrimicrobium sp. IK]|uniref:MCE family protein n=1 Tax=Acidiferrimicrobium sp. IK TaxID=2871700 RepID=UPI0021CAFD54|nr:MCE family protein [Acidiferrimicrobium sp. IK]MCU4184606.1 MCE family protein [Acidiferrimicrobium sp. IK]